MFPLYEFENGSYKIKKNNNRKTIEEYLKFQGRFKHLSKEELREIQNKIDFKYDLLLKKEKILS